MSFEELQSDIDILFDTFEGVDDHALDFGVTAIYLAWFGININEAIAIKKENVALTSDQIYLPISERFINMDSKPIEFIRNYLQAEGYNTLPDDKDNIVFCEYKPSEFLLRTLTQETITENDINDILLKLSNLYKKSGKDKEFNYSQIQESGLNSK